MKAYLFPCYLFCISASLFGNRIDAFSVDVRARSQHTSLYSNWNAGDLSKPSYSDNFLLNFHNQAQEEKQLVTNSLSVWNEDLQREQEEIAEWKDAFDRNGLADFTPPMTNGLNCLMVGDGTFAGRPGENNRRTGGIREDQLPWEDEPGADVISLRVIDTQPEQLPAQDEGINNTLIPSTALLKTESTSVGLVPSQGTSSAVEDDASTSVPMSVNPDGQPAAVYDCIVDQGLMDSVLAMQSTDTIGNVEQTIRELVFEAATAIREHGIYVLVTQSLTDQQQTLLEEASATAGLEWNFRLDGLSEDGTQVVSVARRYCTGSLPPVGKLSRYQPNN